MPDTAEQLMQRIEEIDTAAAENRLRAERYQRMTEQLADVVGVATSPDDAVTVECNAGGSIHSITFADRIQSIPPADLAASVQHTIAAAKANAAREQAEVVRSGLGDTELLDRVLGEDIKVFGDHRAVDPGPAPAVSPTAHVEDNIIYEPGTRFRRVPGRST